METLKNHDNIYLPYSSILISIQFIQFSLILIPKSLISTKSNYANNILKYHYNLISQPNLFIVQTNHLFPHYHLISQPSFIHSFNQSSIYQYQKSVNLTSHTQVLHMDLHETKTPIRPYHEGLLNVHSPVIRPQYQQLKFTYTNIKSLEPTLHHFNDIYVPLETQKNPHHSNSRLVSQPSKCQHQQSLMIAKIEGPKLNLCQLSNLDISTALFILQLCISEYLPIKKMNQYPILKLHNFQIDTKGKINATNLHQQKLEYSTQGNVFSILVGQFARISVSGFQDFAKYYSLNHRRRRIHFKNMFSLINSYMTCSKIKPIQNLSARYLPSRFDFSMKNNSESKVRSRNLIKTKQFFSQSKYFSPHKRFRIDTLIESNKKSTQKVPKFFSKFSSNNASIMDEKQQFTPKLKKQKSIQQQYSYVIHPLNETHVIKQSTTSTKGSSDQHKISFMNSNRSEPRDQKSSGKPDKIISTNLGYRYHEKLNLKSFPENVIEVESEGTISDNQMERSYRIQMKNQQYQNDTQRDRIMKNEMEILSKNCWQKKIKRLITENQEADIASSYLAL